MISRTTSVVYKAEKADGLAERIRQEKSILCFSRPTLLEPFPVSEKIYEQLRTKSSTEDFDLHFLNTILVSTGCNKNDDVFDPLEVWSARHTPEDKPFNYEHDCADIIGHITSNRVVDEKNEIVAEDTDPDDLPARFHILTSAVLYKYWSKEDLQERMDKLIAEIREGKWFVSMECLFRNFDYALVEDGHARVIARNQKTAFLTKYLKAYGGPGKYNGTRIGRLVRNITFSGKGLVKNPANPDSIIFSEDFSNTSSSQVYLAEKEISMQELEKQIEALKVENDALKASLAENSTKTLKVQLDKLDKDLAKATETETALKTELTKAQEQLAEVTKVKTETISLLETELAESRKNLETSQAELTTLKTELATQARIKQIVAELKLAETEAVELVKSFSGLSEEAFAATLKTMAKFTPAPLPSQSTPAPLPTPTVPSVPNNKSMANADVANLDNAEPTPELNTVPPTDAVAELQQSIAAYLKEKK
jgi:hypothetical protein